MIGEEEDKQQETEGVCEGEEGDRQEESEGCEAEGKLREEGDRQGGTEGCEWKQNCDLSCLAPCPPVHQDAGLLRLLLFM